MFKQYFLTIIFLACTLHCFSQNEILCSEIKSILTITDSNNIPNVIDNTNGTKTLIFPSQTVTNVFNDYIIYDFYQTFPSASGVLEQFYTIVHSSKSLIERMVNDVPIDVISAEDYYYNYESFFTPISADIFTTLNGNSYDLSKYITTSDSDPCDGCPLLDVPSDFTLSVTFNYDEQLDMLYMETVNTTPCGNTFTIGLKGGNPNGFTNLDNTLQLWEAVSGISNESDFNDICTTIESTLYNILDIVCSGATENNITVTFNESSNTMQWYKTNDIFGYDSIEFSDVNLSIQENEIIALFPYKEKGNPYLQLRHFEDEHILIEVFNMTGQLVIPETKFQDNSINVSILTNGIYLIKLSNSDNQQKIFKFLKN
ncbi:MAG: T9SS type A sorting domain-containing protein [Psychroserpens sp.]|uniref:T9SS type A sorting domain-containing protein n=1 Tax=Psychroserpens sp. TaxID=2020870 RepID=UPI003C8EE5E6